MIWLGIYLLVVAFVFGFLCNDEVYGKSWRDMFLGLLQAVIWPITVFCVLAFVIFFAGTTLLDRREDR